MDYLINLFVFYTIAKNFILYNLLFFLTLLGFSANEYDLSVHFDDKFNINASYFLYTIGYKNKKFNDWVKYYGYLHKFKTIKINSKIYSDGKIDGKSVPFNDIKLFFES